MAESHIKKRNESTLTLWFQCCFACTVSRRKSLLSSGQRNGSC